MDITAYFWARPYRKKKDRLIHIQKLSTHSICDFDELEKQLMTEGMNRAWPKLKELFNHGAKKRVTVWMRWDK